MREVFAHFFGDKPHVLDDLEQKSTYVQFTPGETIFAEEEEGNSVFYILSGTVKAVLYSQDGEEIWLDEFGSGTLFGEMAVLSQESRTADIVASSNVELACFTAACFIELMETHGIIGVKVSKMLANRVHKTTRRMFELTAVSAKGRVYSELLRLAETSEDTLTIKNLPAYTVIAKRINSTRETVSRTVNDLARHGFVKKEGTSLQILVPEELRYFNT